MVSRFSLFTAALAFAAAASSQTPPASPVVASVDVKVVNVDISVTDGSGKPVDGLTRDDFEVLEDGQPQAITNFSVTQQKMRQAAAAPAPQQPRRRKIIILIDNNYIESRDRTLALDILDRFIDDRFDPDSEWSLGTIGQSLEIVQPLTSDRKAIHDAVSKARHSGTVSLRTDSLDREILGDPFRRNASASSGYDYAETVRFQGRERTSRNARALANTANGLTEAARSYAGVGGKKTIVLLSGGMEMNTTFSAYDNDRDRETRDRKMTMAKLLEQIVHEVNGGDMSIYVVNIRPADMAAPQHDVENQAWGGLGTSSLGASDTSDVNSAAFALAASTGGLYFTSYAVRQSLESVDSVSANYYSLGYSPPHREDGQYHTITVRLKKPNLRAVHRRGYLDVSPDEQLEQYLKLRISVLQPSNSVPVKFETQPGIGPDGKPVVQLTAVMPWQNVTLLRSGDEQYKGRVHVYVSIFDKNGKNVGFHHKTQDVALTPDQYAKALAGAFGYRMALRLESGEFTVAVTMRDDLSREIGTGVKKLQL
jgi:VWFA-related protein